MAIRKSLTLLQREYFFEINPHGQLFHEDVKHKNFTTQHTHIPFLNLFYRNITKNNTNNHPLYEYISNCGKEINYIKSKNPIVFQKLENEYLFYGGDLKIKFDIHKLRISRNDGLFYHLFDIRGIKYGVLRDALVLKLFFNDLDDEYITYKGVKHSINWID